MRFLETRIHGYIDYVAGLIIAASPWIFNFYRGGAETWVPVIVGAGGILYSLFTDYELGAVRRMLMRTHLALDLVAGLFLAISPWILGFSEYVWLPHLLLGVFEMGASLVTKTEPGTSTGHSGRTIAAH